jgi:hypothetical protein
MYPRLDDPSRCGVATTLVLKRGVSWVAPGAGAEIKGRMAILPETNKVLKRRVLSGIKQTLSNAHVIR